MNIIDNASLSLVQQEMSGVRHLAATSPLSAQTIASRAPEGESPSGVSFHQVMRDALEHVDSLQHAASAQQNAVSSGQSDDLVGAMLASQQASLSFSALVQVRNKVASGVNDLMNMSI
ncbi:MULTISPECIES: flagellar hook-basal body complex protein FliE [Pseudescherichia]|uniref:flagellar hook-basal body complex protein FliE n=1 Tax=Pseudescherichia TaxID=2055880 RepID=UPI0028A11B99|nr:flagellar hook-basal body complex protein FliE [Pseudescherichia sp.]